MADAYATLANGGIHHDPTAISKVEFPNGKVDESGADDGERVLTPGQAYEVTRILEGVITSGTGAGYTSIGCAAEAGKTGTSEEESDAWFVGYTPMFSTAVWVGHPTVARIHRLRRPDRRPDLAELHVESAQEGECPEFEVPESLPELSGLDSDHTSSSGYSSGYDYEEEESYEAEEEDEERRKATTKRKAAMSRLPNRKRPGPDASPRAGTERPDPTRRRRHQPRLAPSALLADQLDPVAVRVADEADAVALGAAAGAVGGLLGLDAFGGEALEGAVEVVDGEGDVVVAGAEFVGVDAVVVGQLQARVLAGHAHEDVDRLVADRHPRHLLEAELGVEGDRAVDVADPVAGVEEAGHRPLEQATCAGKLCKSACSAPRDAWRAAATLRN